MTRLHPQWIFLDFDGVIMDSMTLKLDAYCFAFKEYGFPREKIREQQLMYAGLSRSRALPIMFEALAGKPMSGKEAQRALHLFGEEDDRLREKMRFMPGSLDFLKRAHNLFPLVVVTGTPQEAIEKTIAMFELQPFFKEVCGSPPVKSEHLQSQLVKHGLKPEQALYVGDSIQDYKAANFAGMPFVGVDNGDHPFADLNLAVELRSLAELSDWVEWPQGLDSFQSEVE